MSQRAETAAAGVTTTNFHPRLSGPDASHPGPGFVQRRAQWGKKKYCRIHFYDENRQFLAQINPNSFSQVVTAPEYDEQVRTYRLTVSNKAGEQ